MHVELTVGDKTVVVEINDVGAGNPKQESRALDLSRAAASALTGTEINNDKDAKGVGLIHLDSIRPVSPDTPVGPPPVSQPIQ
jgi:rare lipoprotein A (peptidoglycan hydrolase)